MPDLITESIREAFPFLSEDREIPERIMTAFKKGWVSLVDDPGSSGKLFQVKFPNREAITFRALKGSDRIFYQSSLAPVANRSGSQGTVQFKAMPKVVGMVVNMTDRELLDMPVSEYNLLEEITVFLFDI